jgi:hypothetical protein
MALARAAAAFFSFICKKKKRKESAMSRPPALSDFVAFGRERPAAFAARLGVARSTISRAIRRGRLVLGSDGCLDVSSSLILWQQTTSGLRPDVSARHAAGRRSGLTGGAAEPVVTGDVEEDQGEEDHGEVDGQDSTETIEHGTLRYWTARRLAAQNGLALLSLQMRRHQRYARDAVRREAHAIGGVLRAALERMVDQTAPRLAAADPDARTALVAAELALVRRAIREEFVRSLRRLRKP